MKINTKILKYNDKDNSELFKITSEIIKNGGIVAFPTETVYGLGANAFNKEAVLKIYSVKNRPKNKPLIVHISDADNIYKIASFISNKAKILIKNFWPGPLTLIFHKKNILPKETTGNLDTVAIRYPDNIICENFIRSAGGFIAATSANISTHITSTSTQHVLKDLNNKIDAIIDGGDNNIGIESTILDMTTEIPTILRLGYITKNQIEKLIGPVLEYNKNPDVENKQYIKNAPLTIIKGDEKNVLNKLIEISKEAKLIKKSIGIITTDENINKFNYGKIKSIGSIFNHDQIAHNLYKILREFDNIENIQEIYCPYFESNEIMKAVMDKLLKYSNNVINVNNFKIKFKEIIFISYTDMDIGPLLGSILSSQNNNNLQIKTRACLDSFDDKPINSKILTIIEYNKLKLLSNTAKILKEKDIKKDTLFITINKDQKFLMLKKYPKIQYIFTLSEYIGESYNKKDYLIPFGENLFKYNEFYDKIHGKVKKIFTVKKWRKI